MTKYSDTELDAFEAILENAVWTLDDDAYIEFVMNIDPDCQIEQALEDRASRAESIRRASLSDDERAAEDAQSERMVARGMVVVRRMLDEMRAKQRT